jgi:hypothetical protein
VSLRRRARDDQLARVRAAGARGARGRDYPGRSTSRPALASRPGAPRRA